MLDIKNQIKAISNIDPKFYNLSPTGMPVYWYRGIAHYDLNEFELALKDFKVAYKNHPYHIFVLNNLASSYEIKGNHEKAIKYYNKVLEISPKFDEALINLSAVYYNIGKYEKAFQTISKCDPKTKNIKYNIYKSKIKNKLDN